MQQPGEVAVQLWVFGLEEVRPMRVQLYVHASRQLDVGQLQLRTRARLYKCGAAAVVIESLKEERVTRPLPFAAAV